jgi:hypothetical protein
MEKPTKIAIVDVLKMRDAAEQMPAPECAEVSRQRAIAMMAPALLSMHNRGYTWPVIVKWLREQGLLITSTTLQKVLRRAVVKRDTDLGSPPEASCRPRPAAAAAKPPRRGPPDLQPVDRRSVTKSPPAEGRESAPRSGDSAVPSGTPAPPPTASSVAALQPTAAPKGTFVMRPDTPNL